MTEDSQSAFIVEATSLVNAPPGVVFEFIADPSKQPLWDGNDNLTEAATGQRVRAVGDVFTMVISKGTVRENHVVEFEEGRRIAWLPADAGASPAGHLWRWQLQPAVGSTTKVTHTYDWSRLTDTNRFAKARSITQENLYASLVRLARLVEGS